jgi:MFS family permease
MQDLERTSRRITATLFAAQSLSSAAVIAMATIMSIVAAQLYGDASQAGLPNAVNNLSAAPAAFLWGVLWDRLGRRLGLTLGLVVGVFGAVLTVVAVQTGSFLLFLVGMAGLGVTRAAVGLGRFIASEVSPPDRRGRAISYVVLGGTVGAILGPLLVSPSSKWAVASGLDELTGPFAVSILLFAIVAIVTYWGLNPEPMEISKKVDEQFPQTDQPSGDSRSIRQLIRLPAVRVAVFAMALPQMVMVMVMGMTSLHMREHNHALAAISLVFSAHTLGMFAFSIVSGRLSDRWGRGQVILVGTVFLLVSFTLAPMRTTTSMLAFSLFLLGLGWNFCFVAGSALLADQLYPPERARTQGFNDVFIGLATAGGSYGSGLILAAWGYTVLNQVSAAVILFPLVLTTWWLLKHN